jgi:hypothetical protein
LWAAILLGAALFLFVGAALYRQQQPDPRTSAPVYVPPPPPDDVSITYLLDGSANSADITYTDASGNIEQQSGLAVPLARKSGVRGIEFTAHSGDFVQFMAQNMGESGDLTCTIKADGRTINTGHSSGGYTIVSCSATVP